MQQICSVAFIYSILSVIKGYASSLGPMYAPNPRFCSHDSQCSSDLNQVCVWMYEGCGKGQCMCDPMKQYQDVKGVCRDVRLGGDFCTGQAHCPDDMVCQRGTCRCPYNEDMTSDKLFCIQENYKLLRQSCTPSVDVCFQKSSYGYTTNDMFCSRGRKCECEEGYKEIGITCRKWNIGEYGCRRSINCEGGALCIHDTCQCPNGYIAIAGNTKCAKMTGVQDLPLGSACDEINERAYCGHGLVCRQCYEHVQYRCARFILGSQKAYLFSSSSPSVTSSSFQLLLLILPSWLLVLLDILNGNNVHR